MNQADKDAQAWQEMQKQWQKRRLIYAKETGTPYHINERGDVVMEKPNDIQEIITHLEKARYAGASRAARMLKSMDQEIVDLKTKLNNQTGKDTLWIYFTVLTVGFLIGKFI